MKYIILAILFTSAFCGWSFGGCPSVQREKGEFQVDKYLGKWYEQARDKSFRFSKGECVQADYSLNEKKNVHVHNSEVVEGKRTAAEGEAVLVDNFKLEVTFGENPLSKYIKGDYQILRTDYENYSLVYSCTDLYLAKMELVWILARKPQLDQGVLNELVSHVNSLGIGKESIRFTDQSGQTCGY